jgi:PEP-CTERM motif
MMRAFFFVALFLGVTALSSASSLQVLTNAVDAVCIGSSTPPFCSVFYDKQDQNAAGTAAIAGTFGPTSAQETVSADAHAAYGVLNASASSSYSVVGTPEADFVTANSTFEDILTITDPSLNGQQGLLFLSYSLDGQVSGSSFAVVITEAGTNLGQQWAQQYKSSVDGTFSLPDPIQFVYGQAFGLSIQLSVSAGTPTGYGVLNPETGSGSGSANFFDTFVLTGLDPTTASGDPVSGAVFSSQSGTAYSVGGVAPEPSSTVLMLLGLAAIVVANRRKSHALSSNSGC